MSERVYFGPRRYNTPSQFETAKLRLGHRAFVLEYLVEQGGSASVDQIAKRFDKRKSDVRRRILPRMVDVGVVYVEGEAVYVHQDYERRLAEDNEDGPSLVSKPVC